MYDVRKFSLHPFQFEELSPTEFEQSIAFLYQLQGYQTTVCGGAGDEGVDVEARKDGELMIVQCKRYTKTNMVGSPAIQILFAATTANRANKGVIVTTSWFTKQAQQYAQNKPIELIDRGKLDRLAKHYHIGPYFVASEKLQARMTFFHTLCQRVGKRFLKGEDDFMDTLELSFKNVTFDELLWIRSFAQKNQERIKAEVNMSNFTGALLDATPKSSLKLQILSLDEVTLDSLVELINYFKASKPSNKNEMNQQG